MYARTHAHTQRLYNWKEGAVVYIQATAPDNTLGIDFAKTFQPNYRRSELPLHMSVRLSEDHVIFNSKTKEKWEGEEIPSDMPFNEGKEFSLTVCAQRSYFEIGVNSDFFKRFQLRTEIPEEMSVQLRNATCIKRIAYHH